MTRKYQLITVIFLMISLIMTGCGGNSDNADRNGKNRINSNESNVALNLAGTGNTPANLLHDGMAAEYEGYIYHIDKMINGNLWRTSIDTGESELLLKGMLHDINVNGGAVFTLGSIPDPNDEMLSLYGLFRINMDGSNLTIIKEGSFEELILKDDYLYFTEIIDGGLYKIRYDGSEEKKLLDDIYDNVAIIDENIYLMSDLDEEYVMNIYKLDLEGRGQPEKVINDVFGGTFDVVGNEIFYIARDNTSNIYRYDTLTGEKELFLSKWVDYLNTDGEHLYYFWSGRRQDNSDSGVYKSSLDGSGEEMIMPADVFFSLNIAGGKMFWHNNDDERRISVMNLDGSNIGFIEQAGN
ncbi:DUF5050 domain-containing protein [Alkalibacter saccharofermentans]|uniref:Prolow-density lipoprotein receptor-related protein 1-like beta-propeller domain-containing protein n=1 Tax=Alkalibacter saccharofermentans DSM 14828 TaxID=1120975 RepID=A0A1M4UPS0_9FIRM|nr:DUF5050 domain-containing protein [Alkalibacter saccharofermentans]SHE58647.1 protein of unknown function [Alkalibacter saccharofermentans DSM 14828]